MKKVIRSAKKHAPFIRMKVVKKGAGKSLWLSIELWPGRDYGKASGARRIYLSRTKRKQAAKHKYPVHGVKKFGARPVVGYMNIAQKIAVGRRVFVHMINNSDFAGASATLYALRVVIDFLDEAYSDALQCSRSSELEKLGKAENNFDTIYSAIVLYVDEKANGSEQVYRNAGMEVVVVYGK